MLIDCHLHTLRYSACSRLSPQRACELALRRGLSAIVFTEHQMLWPDSEIEELRRAYPLLGIYAGMETTLAEGYDLVFIGPGLPRGLPYCLSLNRLAKTLARQRGELFVFLAHAFRYVDSYQDDLGPILEYVDAVESNSLNILRNGALCLEEEICPFQAELYAKAKLGFGLPGVYNSDGHSESAVASIANRIEAARLPEDVARLAELLKAEKINPWQDKARVREHLELYFPEALLDEG